MGRIQPNIPVMKPPGVREPNARKQRVATGGQLAVALTREARPGLQIGGFYGTVRGAEKHGEWTRTVLPAIHMNTHSCQSDMPFSRRLPAETREPV